MAHSRLAELLPGEGPLAERYRCWQDSMLVPAEEIERTAAAVIEQARVWTRGFVALPDGEGVVVEAVRDRPWLIHETYPGHHAERCLKEQLLVRGRGLLEETLVLAPTPQSLVSEGIAELAPAVVLEGGGGAALAAVVHDTALMLHDAGASESEARAYLERWALMSPKLAAQLIRFLADPASRTYAITYSAGRELCRSYAVAEPEGFRRLLTEQVRVSDVVPGASPLQHGTTELAPRRGAIAADGSSEAAALDDVGHEPPPVANRRSSGPASLIRGRVNRAGRRGRQARGGGSWGWR